MEFRESGALKKCALMAERMTYQAMIAASPLTPSNSSRGMHVSRKIYFTSLPFQPHVLNFKANMGISLTSK